MYLTVKQCDLLDSAVKSFEVAFRSYVANKIISELQTESMFKEKIDELNSSIEQSSIILSGKMKSLLKKITSNTSEFYSNLQYANDCFLNRKESELSHDVSYVSEIIGLSYLFATSYFSNLLRFKTKEEFLYLSVCYYNVRNALSHRGSELVTQDDMLNTTYFMSEMNDCLDEINPNYFWYRSKLRIDKIISKLMVKSDIPVAINNINSIAFSDKKFVCRESELAEMKKLTYPKENFLKKPTSICIYGYGGVGKTALLHEYLKLLIKDIHDNNIDEDYFKYVLFFTAKDARLSYNLQTGEIEEIPLVKQFSTYDELKNQIFMKLGIESFEGFTEHGIIILDNIESISDSEEHAKINNFIQFESPANIQYIITSRKPEEADKKIALNSFNKESGKVFIENYIFENELNVTLTDEQSSHLLELSRGNALVLVLSLNRLDAKLVSFDTITKEFKDSSYKRIENELNQIPPMAFEVISDFMYRNTIQEIETLYEEKAEHIFAVLKALAVYEEALDEYTLCLVTKIGLEGLKDILNILLKYLIIEKNNDTYVINEFANKYILERFIPNSIERNELYLEIKFNIKKIRSEIDELDKKAKENPKLNQVLNDWLADCHADKIAITKAYSIYSNLLYSLKHQSGYILEESIKECVNELQAISQVTIHPYIDFQKAALYSKIDYELNKKTHQKQIKKYYEQCISTIRFYYQNIKNTYSFAVVLWKYGQYLTKTIGDDMNAARYFQEAIEIFEIVDVKDSNYYQCLLQLGNVYMCIYNETRKTVYKKEAEEIAKKVNRNIKSIKKDHRKYVEKLNDSINGIRER